MIAADLGGDGQRDRLLVAIGGTTGWGTRNRRRAAPANQVLVVHLPHMQSDASEQALSNLIKALRASDAVVVLGAGLSFAAGMPLSDQLLPIVWQVLTQNPALCSKIAKEFGVIYTSVKSLIPDFERSKTAFRYIAADPIARQDFQDAFSRLDESRRNSRSEAHDVIARLVYQGRVALVVSLNWDTLLETAFTRRFGVEINAQDKILIKPHGDVRAAKDPWVLPHDAGNISDYIISRLDTMVRDRPRALLLVGYSESDTVVVQRLIEPLAGVWQVFRVGPGASGEGAIRLGAAEAMSRVAERLPISDEHPGWGFVHFDKQRNLAAAISGEKLGARDVEVCPKLPGYIDAVGRLRTLNFVELAGDSGSGKSITAFQLAHSLNAEGRPVLRPVTAFEGDCERVIRSVQGARLKSVLVVDDSQLYPIGFYERLVEIATPNLQVIVTTTDPQWVRTEAVRMAQTDSVQYIADEFRRSRDEVLKIVRELDPSVQDQAFSESMEDRIETAQKADTVWHFNFILRGGWQQIKAHMSALRDRERADIFIFLVAVHQLLSLDAGVEPQDFNEAIRILGRGNQWIEQCRVHCQKLRILQSGGTLKLVHLRLARVSIKSFPAKVDDPEIARVLATIRFASSRNPSLRGISWLLQELSTDALWRFGQAIFDDTTLDRLFKRCFDVVAPGHRKDAVRLLASLMRYIPARRLLERSELLKEWMETVEADYAYELGDLMNELHNHDKDLGVQFFEGVDEVKFRSRILSPKHSDGYRWGHLLGRVATTAGGEWRARFGQVIDDESIREFARSAPAQSVSELMYFARCIHAVSTTLSLQLVEILLPQLGQAIIEAPYRTLSDIRETLWWTVGPPPPGFPYKRTKEKADLARSIAKLIPTKDFALEFSSSRPYEWQMYHYLIIWLWKVRKKVVLGFAENIDTSKLDEVSGELWLRPNAELEIAITLLAGAGTKARDWVISHEAEIEMMLPIAAWAAPEVAVRIVKRGGMVRPLSGGGSSWQVLGAALAHVQRLDSDAAKAIAHGNVDLISGWINEWPQTVDEHIVQMLQFVRQLDPLVASEIIEKLDVERARKNWPTLCRRKGGVKKGFEHLLEFVGSQNEGAIGEMARELMMVVKS